MFRRRLLEDLEMIAADDHGDDKGNQNRNYPPQGLTRLFWRIELTQQLIMRSFFFLRRPRGSFYSHRHLYLLMQFKLTVGAVSRAR